MSLARRYIPLAVVSLSVLGVDQLVKRLVDHNLVLHESLEVFPGLLSLTYTRNRGTAFGLFSDAKLPAQAGLLTLVSLTALIAICVYFFRLPADRRLPRVGLSLVLAGAIGNLIDRIRFGYVIDFLDVYWRNHHWPTFNVADSAISVGVGLLLIDMLWDSGSRRVEPGVANARTAAGRME